MTPAAIRVVITIPRLKEHLFIIHPDSPDHELLDDWQKDEIVREIFDRMESNFSTFLKNIQKGVSPAHICDREYTDQEIQLMDRLMMEVGCMCWFACSQNRLFKTEIPDQAKIPFIDTFPLFLDVVGDDYVILQHNELTKEQVVGLSMFS